MSTREAIRTAKVRRLAEFRAFPKHWQGRAGKGKHRRDPKHRGVLDKYAHLGYRVIAGWDVA